MYILAFQKLLSKHNTTEQIRLRPSIEYFSDASFQLTNNIYSDDFDILGYTKI